jgi:hypothetical protein
VDRSQFRQHNGQQRLSWKTDAGRFLYSIVGVGSEALAWGGVLVIAGLPIYFWLRRKS